MKTEVTLTILERLVDGIHPITGEVLPADHVCLEADINAALRHAMAAVAQLDDAPEEAKYIRKNGKLNAGRPWTAEDDLELMTLMQQGVDLEEICRRTQRRRRGVMNRWAELNEQPAPRRESRAGLPANAGQPWYPADDARLRNAFLSGASIAALADDFQRTRGSIRSRLKLLGLIEE